MQKKAFIPIFLFVGSALCFLSIKFISPITREAAAVEMPDGQRVIYDVEQGIGWVPPVAFLGMILLFLGCVSVLIIAIKIFKNKKKNC